MKQICNTCITTTGRHDASELPCNIELVEAAEFENCRFWTPAKPWEEKWIVPEGCEILAESGKYYTGFDNRDGFGFELPDGIVMLVKWSKDSGHGCGKGRRLIPKEPPIEKSEDFNVFKKWTESSIKVNMLGKPVYPCNLTLIDNFKALKKVFKMELK